MVTNYQMDSNNMTNETESTTAISMMSYDIENANDNDLSKSDINDQLENLKETNKFPSNQNMSIVTQTLIQERRQLPFK